MYKYACACAGTPFPAEWCHGEHYFTHCTNDFTPLFFRCAACRKLVCMQHQNLSVSWPCPFCHWWTEPMHPCFFRQVGIDFEGAYWTDASEPAQFPCLHGKKCSSACPILVSWSHWWSSLEQLVHRGSAATGASESPKSLCSCSLNVLVQLERVTLVSATQFCVRSSHPQISTGGYRNVIVDRNQLCWPLGCQQFRLCTFVDWTMKEKKNVLMAPFSRQVQSSFSLIGEGP